AMRRLPFWPGRSTLVTPSAAAAVPAPAASVTPASAARATAATAVLARLRLVHGQRAAARELAVEASDGGLRLLLGLHLHEAEALGAAGVAVHDDLGRLHRAEGRAHLLQRAVGHVVT